MTTTTLNGDGFDTPLKWQPRPNLAALLDECLDERPVPAAAYDLPPLLIHRRGFAEAAADFACFTAICLGVAVFAVLFGIGCVVQAVCWAVTWVVRWFT